jgi:peptide/nickel transport system substrate-binding protein
MTSRHDRVDTLVDDYLARRIDRRQFFQRAVGLGLSAGAAGSILAACGGDDEAGPAEEGPKRGGTLRVRILADISNTDPAFWPATPDEAVMASVGEGLVTFKPGAAEFEVVNQLAETFEPSADGLSYEFKLKEGIQFHAGYGEVTSEDVKFSYERIGGLTKPKIDSPYQGDWAALQEVRIKDKYSGTIILKEPFAALLSSTLPVGAGIVLSKKAIEELGKKYATNPIGTGPYEFVKWTPDQSVVLRRFRDYKTGFMDPEWDEIHFIPIQDDSAADIALETGEIDFGNISLPSIERFQENDDFVVVDKSTLDYNWIGMNILHPKLTDVNVRQAIRYGVDVPAMLEAAFEGRYERATAIIPPNMGLGYWENAPVYERDVERAKGFLQTAGVSSLDLTLTYTEETGSDEVFQIAQANLKEIGINLKPDKVEGAGFYELGENLQERQLFYVGFVTEPDPSWSMVWFTCDQIDVWNWMYSCDEEFDRLQKEALLEQDESKRHEMYIEMQERWDAAVHTVWTHWPTLWFGHRKGLKPAINPHGRVIAYAFTSA